MNHDQLGYTAFMPKLRISKIKFETPGENLAAVNAAHCGMGPIFSLDYHLTRSEMDQTPKHTAVENTETAPLNVDNCSHDTFSSITRPFCPARATAREDLAR